MEKIYDMITASEFTTMFAKIAEDSDIKVCDDHIGFVTDNNDDCIYGASIYFNGWRVVSVMDIKANKFTIHHFNGTDLFTTIEPIYS